MPCQQRSGSGSSGGRLASVGGNSVSQSVSQASSSGGLHLKVKDSWVRTMLAESSGSCAEVVVGWGRISGGCLSVRSTALPHCSTPPTPCGGLDCGSTPPPDVDQVHCSARPPKRLPCCFSSAPPAPTLPRTLAFSSLPTNLLSQQRQDRRLHRRLFLKPLLIALR